MVKNSPRLVVFTTLFPNPAQPIAGLFIRERMFRVGQRLPLVVVAPTPWFPFQGIIRYFRPHFRPLTPRYAKQQGVEVYHPRFFCVPGLFKWLDGLFLALGSVTTLLRLQYRFGFAVIDAHFAYPDGYAATLLGRWFKVPVTVTLRGTEVRMAETRLRRRQMIVALQRARRVFAVCESLKELAVRLGIARTKIQVIGNGVAIERFMPVPKEEARDRLDLLAESPVLISVGALVERKGFHRVIALLPELRKEFPGLQYLIVGGPSPEGDWSEQLRRQVDDLQLNDCVRFLGALAPEDLKVPLSAADVFVLPTRNEGWANVFLEAMACGLPVVTTEVGGNREVISSSQLGKLIPFGDQRALREALAFALSNPWDREAIMAYARRNSWDSRVELLLQEFHALIGRNGEATSLTEG